MAFAALFVIGMALVPTASADHEGGHDGARSCIGIYEAEYYPNGEIKSESCTGIWEDDAQELVDDLTSLG